MFRQNAAKILRSELMMLSLQRNLTKTGEEFETLAGQWYAYKLKQTQQWISKTL